MPVHFDNYSNSPSEHGLSAPGSKGETKTWRRRRKRLICQTQCSEVRGEHSSPKQDECSHPSTKKGFIFHIFLHCLSLLVHKWLHLAITNGRYLAAKKINFFNSGIAEVTRRAAPCSVPPTFSSSDTEIHPSMGYTSDTHQWDAQHPLPKWQHPMKVIHNEGLQQGTPKDANCRSLLLSLGKALGKLHRTTSPWFLVMEGERIQSLSGIKQFWIEISEYFEV